MHILCLRSFLFLTRVERSTSVLAAQHGQYCRGKKNGCAAGRLLSRQQLCIVRHSNRAKTLPSPLPCLYLLVATDRPHLTSGPRAVRTAAEARTRQPLLLCLSVRKFRVGSARVCSFAKSRFTIFFVYQVLLHLANVCSLLQEVLIVGHRTI